MKRFARKLIVYLLSRQVRRLRNKSDFVVVAVTGSIGKSSTKRAIAQVLKAGKRVQWQDGNYNDLISVPLVFFGLDMPNKLLSPVTWVKILWHIHRQSGRPYPYDVVVLELGTDGPNQIAAFKRYLEVDIAVVTAIAPEHMEFFDDIKAVAEEELSIKDFTKKLIVSSDMIEAEYLPNTTPYMTYSIKRAADAHLRYERPKLGAFKIDLKTKKNSYNAIVPFIGVHQLPAAAAAGLVAEMCGLSKEQIEAGLASLTSMPGRMQVMSGKQDSLIIDDTYNASPEAVKAALTTLYGLEASHRVALLGNMNELGSVSPSLHTEIGELCDPKQLDLVVTLGSDANKYLADAAEANGCKVIRTQSPYEAGKIIEPTLTKETVVLAKGSQNRVFAEEAVKILLAYPQDSNKLVRQSAGWLKRKQQQFGDS